jgi:lipopolysaccharide heptosyltransferase I
VLHEGREYYVKSYHPVGLRAWLWQKLRWTGLLPAGKGWREYGRLRELSALGLECPRPVACGEELEPDGRLLHLLITEAVAGAEALPEVAFDPELPPAKRRRLAWDFGRWLRRVHDAHVSHKDPRGSDILVREEGEGYAFVLLDVERVRTCRGLRVPTGCPAEQAGRPPSGPAPQAEMTLAAAEALAQHAVPASLRLLALKGYLDRSGRFTAEDRALARRVYWRSRRRLEESWRRSSLRALRTNREFVVGRAGPRRFALRAEWASGLVGDLLTDPEQLFMLPDVEVLKSDRRATTVKVTPEVTDPRLSAFGGEGPRPPVGGPPTGWVVKRFEPPVGAKRWASLFRRSRAWRSWWRANEMLVRRLPVPTPVAAVEVRRWGMLQEAYFISAAVPGTRLLEFVRERGFDPEVLWKLGRELRRLHDLGFHHRDLKASNILVSGGPGNWRLWIVDLESVQGPAFDGWATRLQFRPPSSGVLPSSARRPGRDSRRPRLKQLARLWQHLLLVRSLEEGALRAFLRGYLPPGDRRPDGLAAWVEDIFREAAPARRGAAPPQKILIVKPSSLGDVIHALPLAVALKEAFPRAELHWVVGRAYAELLAAQPSVDDVLVFDRGRWGGLGFWRNRREWWGLLRRLRSANYDVVIDLQGLARSALLARASGASVRVGLATAREFGRLAYTVAVSPREPDAHAVDRYLEVLRALGVAPARVPVNGRAPRFALSIPEEARARVEAELAQELVTEDIVCVAPGARWETKRWPAERFAEVAVRLAAESGVRIIVVGTEEDQPLARTISARVGEQALDWTGRTSLVQLAALFARSALLLTNDSGPMHLAAALGTPVVAIFGPTNPSRTGPYSDRAVVVRSAVHCAPCYQRSCSRRTCLAEVRVEDVVSEVRALLRGEPRVPAEPARESEPMEVL